MGSPITYHLATLQVVFNTGTLQFISFHLCFGTFEISSLYLMWRLYKDSTNLRNPAPHLTKRDRAQYQWLARRGFILYLIAYICWQIDLTCCDFIATSLPINPQLHAWWHVLVTCGIYHMWV